MGERAKKQPPDDDDLPGELKTIVANCLAHGRRQFVDVADRFPDECQHVLEALKVVYHTDAEARKRKLSPVQRLQLHRTKSEQSMTRLHDWLHVPGAPLDNTICERALKRAILHRKNALFYRSRRGAHVGDMYMSLIHTCELCGASPFDYLIALHRHADQAAASADRWLPWNYRATLEAELSAA